MNSTTALDSAQRFFNDLIGLLVPGMTALALANHFFQVPALSGGSLGELPAWLVLAISAYVLGHVVISVGESIVQPILDVIMMTKAVSWLRKAMPWFRRFKTESELYDEIAQQQTYGPAVRSLETLTGVALSETRVRGVRNVAMSLLPPIENEKIYKFTFTAQLCLGVATAVFVVIFAVALLEGANALLTLLDASTPPWLSVLRPRGVWSFAIPLTASLFLLERWQRFHSITLRVPFSMVLGQVGQSQLGRSNVG